MCMARARSAAVKPPIPQSASMAVRRAGKGGEVPISIQMLRGVMWNRPRRVCGRPSRMRMGMLLRAEGKVGRWRRSPRWTWEQPTTSAAKANVSFLRLRMPAFVADSSVRQRSTWKVGLGTQTAKYGVVLKVKGES